MQDNSMKVARQPFIPSNKKSAQYSIQKVLALLEFLMDEWFLSLAISSVR